MKTHDVEAFRRVVGILSESASGKTDYGLRTCKTRHGKTRLHDVADVMNSLGLRNRAGGLWTSKSLTKVIYRTMKKHEIRTSLMPDWDSFAKPSIDVRTESESTPIDSKCIVCRQFNKRKGKQTCSIECGKEYQQFSNLPCSPGYASFFHELNALEAISNEKTL
jgi:hypothetical protein